MKQFLPFLTDDQGRSLDVENEVVVTRSLPNPIDNSPEGWEGNTIQFARNNEFRGIIKSYTTTLKFYLQGAKILRDAYYRKGTETVLFFIWLKLNQSFGAGMKYEGWYKGEPDLGTFKDEYNGVSVNITEGGFYKDLQANKGVVYEMPFDNDAKSLYMDGLNLHQSLRYADLQDLEISISANSHDFFSPYILLGQDGNSVSFIINSQDLEKVEGISFTDKLLKQNYILRNVGLTTVNVNIIGTLEFTCTGMTSSPAYAAKFRFLRSGQTISNQNDYEIISTPGMVVGQTYNVDYNITIPIASNEKLYFEGRFFGGVGVEAKIKFTEKSRSSISFITRQPASVILAYRAFDLGNKLTGRISTGATLSGSILSDDQNLLCTSGDAIRGLVNPVIKTSFSDYHKSIDAVKCIALEVRNNNPVISSRYDKFLKDSQIADLGECVNWTLEQADEYAYDSVEVGYPSKQSDSNIDVNGKYSFNNTFSWKINTTRRKVNAYDAVSKYYADPYDIELIRVNLDNKTTTTGKTDNSVFFIDAEPKTDISFTGTIHFYNADNRIELTGDVSVIAPFIIVGAKLLINGVVWTIKTVIDIDTLDIIVEVVEYIAASSDITGTAAITSLYKLRRLPYTTITGIPDDGTVFNIELSPRRILQNHLRWLRSSFDHLDSNKLVFQTTEKNSSLETIDGSGNVINEKADIPVSTMGEKVYLPYYTKFQVASPYNLLALMTANNSGVFRYSMNAVEMDGFVIEVRTSDSHLETQEYSLLMSANNNNLRLINGR